MISENLKQFITKPWNEVRVISRDHRAQFERTELRDLLVFAEERGFRVDMWRVFTGDEEIMVAGPAALFRHQTYKDTCGMELFIDHDYPEWRNQDGTYWEPKVTLYYWDVLLYVHLESPEFDKLFEYDEWVEYLQRINNETMLDEMA